MIRRVSPILTISPPEARRLRELWQTRIVPFLPEGLDYTDGGAFDLIDEHFEALVHLTEGDDE